MFVFVVMFLIICSKIVVVLFVIGLVKCLIVVILMITILAMKILFNHNESVRVVFPIIIYKNYSHVKFVKLSSRCDFCETVNIKLLKNRF